MITCLSRLALSPRLLPAGERGSLPAPPSVGTACLPVGRGPVGRGEGRSMLTIDHLAIDLPVIASPERGFPGIKVRTEGILHTIKIPSKG